MKLDIMDKGEIIIYQTSDGVTALDVRLEHETIWLTQAQMIQLFLSTKQNVSLHINNIFKEGELDKESVVKEYLTTAADGKNYRTKFYNLDVIISVGYRVKSQRGTQFRIWANKVLKEYLIKGYAVKENIKLEQYEDLKQTIKVLANVLEHKTLEYSEATGLLRVVTDYTYALDTLDRYDYQKLEIDKVTTDYYILLTNFYNQFQTIGNNYNQITRAVRTNFVERRGLAMLYKLEKATFELVLVSKQIIQLTNEFEQKYLQK